ncbi:MAG: AraC family transcriptional regulator [Bacteroidota bacterium]
MVDLENILPINSSLQDCIAYYYFFRNESENYTTDFIHYPHYRTTLNFYLDADISIVPDGRVVRHQANNTITAIGTNNKHAAKFAKVLGSINCIGVVFKPLGFNHFTKKTYQKIFPDSVVLLDELWPNFKPEIRVIFNSASLEEKVQLLDQFFIKRFEPLPNVLLPQIIEAIFHAEGTIKINELERKFSINRRSMLRMFQRHLGCSISRFKQVVKFRNVLNEYQQSVAEPSYTELAYRHNYYDQSDFIKHFKGLTGAIPKEVIKKLTTVGQKDIYWKFEE